VGSASPLLKRVGAGPRRRPGPRWRVIQPTTTPGSRTNKGFFRGCIRAKAVSEGLKKFVGNPESPYHGPDSLLPGHTICRGTRDPGKEILDVTAGSAPRKDIFINVHFRHIRGNS